MSGEHVPTHTVAAVDLKPMVHRLRLRSTAANAACAIANAEGPVAWRLLSLIQSKSRIYTF